VKKPKVFYGVWMVVAGFVLLFMYAGAGFYSFSIFIKPFEDAFGWSRAAISFAMSIYLLLHGVCAPLVGWLTERFGPKRVMTAFAVVTGVAFILVSFTNSLLFFYLSYALLSVGTVGIGWIPISSILARWFVRRRGTAIGFTMVGISAGGFFISPLVGVLNTAFSWRLSYVVMGLMVWLIAIPMTLFVVKAGPAEMGLRPDGDPLDRPDEAGGSEEAKISVDKPEEQGWPFREALKTRPFWWVAVTFFLAPMAQMGILQHQVPLVVEAGLSPEIAATAMGVTAGIGGLGKLSFGRISESLDFKYAATVCFGLQALAVFLLLFFPSAVMVWIYVLLFGFAMGGVVVLLPIAVGQYFGLAAFGTIMGTITFMQSIGSSGGAVISGLIYDCFGNYTYAKILFGSMNLFAIAAIYMAGRPKPYPAVEAGSASG